MKTILALCICAIALLGNIRNAAAENFTCETIMTFRIKSSRAPVEVIRERATSSVEKDAKEQSGRIADNQLQNLKTEQKLVLADIVPELMWREPSWRKPRWVNVRCWEAGSNPHADIATWPQATYPRKATLHNPALLTVPTPFVSVFAWAPLPEKANIKAGTWMCAGFVHARNQIKSSTETEYGPLYSKFVYAYNVPGADSSLPGVSPSNAESRLRNALLKFVSANAKKSNGDENGFQLSTDPSRGIIDTDTTMCWVGKPPAQAPMGWPTSPTWAEFVTRLPRDWSLLEPELLQG